MLCKSSKQLSALGTRRIAKNALTGAMRLRAQPGTLFWDRTSGLDRLFRSMLDS